MKNNMRTILKIIVIVMLFQPSLSFGESAKDQAQIHLDRAWSLFEFQKYEEILKECEEAIKLDPENAVPYFYKGIVFSKTGELSKSDIELDKAISLDKNLGDAYGFKGNNFLRGKQYDEALQEYNKAIIGNATDPLIYAARSDVLMKLGRFEEAILDCDKFITEDDKNDYAYYHKGYILLKFKKYEEALSNFNRALKLNHNVFKYYLHKGYALQKSKRYQESLLVYDEAIQMKDERPEDISIIYENKAEIFFELGQYDKTLNAIDKAIELNNKSSRAYFNKGLYLGEMDRNQDALPYFKKAVELDPNLGPIEKYLNNNDDKR